MSIVSLAAVPTIAIVLGRKLVPEKSPLSVNVSPADRATGRLRVNTVNADLFDFPHLGDDGRGIRTAACDYNLRCGIEHVSVVSRQKVPSQAGEDGIVLRTRITIYHEDVARSAFGSSIDDVASVRRRSRVGVPDEGIVAVVAVQRIVTGPADNRVIARIAVDGIVSSQGVNRVVTGCTIEVVIGSRSRKGGTSRRQDEVGGIYGSICNAVDLDRAESRRVGGITDR